MLLPIPDLLGPDQTAQLRTRLERADWAGGSVLSADASPLARTLGDALVDVASRNGTFFSAALPRRVLPPRFERHAAGLVPPQEDHAAVRYDRGAAVRTDLAALVFLDDPADHDGGELAIDDTFGSQRIKLPAGSAVLYPCGSRHALLPVTRGARYVARLGIQSLLREDAQRRLAFELDVAIRRLTQDVPDHPALAQLTGVYHNLLRRWSDA